MKAIRIISYILLILSCLLSVTNAQNKNYFNSGSKMTYESAYNSLNTGNNSGSSGLSMGGFSTVSSGGSINYNGTKNLTFHEPKNEEITIEYSVPQSVYDDLVKIRHNAYTAYIMSIFNSSSNIKLLKQLFNYKYLDISAYAPVKLTLELRANPPTPVSKYALELQFAAMNYLQKPAGKMIFEIQR